MASQFGMRAAQQAFRQSAFNLRTLTQRRLASTAPPSPAAGTNAQVVRDAAVEQKGFAKLWNSPVGPKTVHFWAPIMKWGLVLAGAADFARPAKDISLSQNAALMATGLIWTRWCFVIRPQNMFLASVNFLLFCVGTTQVSRVLSYQKSLKGTDGVIDAIKGEGKDLETAVGKAESAVEKAESKVEAKLSK